MPIFFSNIAGFWALLGIPLILLIHLLQRQSQIIPSSTLFLLDAIDRQNLQGRKIERLRSSLPLWLQLLAVLILTWLLVEPRWERDADVQRIVIVVDSSASMSAFKEETVAALKKEIPNLTSGLAKISLTLIESHAEGDPLYRGDSLADLLEVVEAWTPFYSAHSPETALQLGRSLAGADGTLIFLTDHESAPDYGAVLLAVGEPIQNVGFMGHTITQREDETVWAVTLKNHSDTEQTREWTLAAGAQQSSPKSITLAPRTVRTLSGKFPRGNQEIHLALSGDPFPQDDALYLHAPAPKQILTALHVSPESEELVSKLVASLENSTPFHAENATGTAPDLVFATYDPLDPSPLPPHAIAFIQQRGVPNTVISGPISAENHPLINHLNWQGLIAKDVPSIPLNAEDTTLLWQGERPLIALRETSRTKQLIFNFDLIQSNAARLPAFIVLIHRFVDLVRQEKIALAVENLELRQVLPIAAHQGEEAPPLSLSHDGKITTLQPIEASAFRAPSVPGFFTLSQGEETLLEGSANFADNREADFRNASSRSDLPSSVERLIEKSTVADPWWRLWSLLLLLTALIIWAVLAKPRSPEKNGSLSPTAP